mmetsp:Transcript_8275/g.20858  ORF Transcript_8275/g.20858 Transcript_8275/m.20858 type:complete len:326 (+) Transcript_8275:290-1267(+)
MAIPQPLLLPALGLRAALAPFFWCALLYSLLALGFRLPLRLPSALSLLGPLGLFRLRLVLRLAFPFFFRLRLRGRLRLALPFLGLRLRLLLRSWLPLRSRLPPRLQLELPRLRLALRFALRPRLALRLRPELCLRLELRFRLWLRLLLRLRLRLRLRLSLLLRLRRMRSCLLLLFTDWAAFVSRRSPRAKLAVVRTSALRGFERTSSSSGTVFSGFMSAGLTLSTMPFSRFPVTSSMASWASRALSNCTKATPRAVIGSSMSTTWPYSPNSCCKSVFFTSGATPETNSLVPRAGAWALGRVASGCWAIPLATPSELPAPSDRRRQ